jgi:hypothetical protein
MQNTFMRKLFCISLISVFFLCCKSQVRETTVTDSTPAYTEFSKNSNGLIYSDQDINALRFVVDSLNLKFKTCAISKQYLCYPQARYYLLRFESKSDNLLEIKRDMDGHPDFYTLAKKYTTYLKEIDSNLLLIKTPVKENDGKAIYISGNSFKGFNRNYVFGRNIKTAAQQCVYEYEKKGEYNSANTIDCYFIQGAFAQAMLPTKYARLIQYIDCMVDTAASIFLGKKDTDPFYAKTSREVSTCYNEINSYLNKQMKIVKQKDSYEFDYLTENKITYAKTNLANNSFLSKKLLQLANVYIANETGDDRAEELVALFVSKQKALEIKRKRVVYGQCSMDNSPRVHAKNIAALAAETHSWDIFLRAHLNIMNDRFERMTDGSYAWDKRQTYIRELEVLDINVIDMMLGLSLRSYNVAEDHYNGTVWRIGKALTESKDRLKFEAAAKDMMKDDELDPFNRSLIFLLYHTYLNYLTDKEERKIKVTAFKQTASQYPAFIQPAIDKMETVLTD